MDQELYVVGQLLRMAEQFASLGDETGQHAVQLADDNGSNDEPAMTGGAARYVRERLIPALEVLVEERVNGSELRAEVEEFARRVRVAEGLEDLVRKGLRQP